MSDFTDSYSVLNFLSSFWTQIFKDQELVLGLSDAISLSLTQAYQDFTEAVNRTAIKTLPVFHREFLVPLVIRKSQFPKGPDKLIYDDGEVFGVQPLNAPFNPGLTIQFGLSVKRAETFFYPLPEGVKDVGNVLINRLIDPSLIWQKDSDFIIKDGLVIFSNDPFSNPLIPTRVIPGDTLDVEPDEQIVLWMTNANVERFNVFQQFGYLFSSLKDSSEAYRLSVELMMKLFSEGPSIAIIDSFIAALAQTAIVKETTETVEAIDVFKDQRLVITDQNVYLLPLDQPLRTKVVVGATLSGGDPLTLATEVVDLTQDSVWWSKVPAMTLGPDYFRANIQSSITWLNTTENVKFVKQVNPFDPKTGLCFFNLAASPEDEKIFWDFVNQESIRQNYYIAPKLWARAGFSSNGIPDYTQSPVINPLQFLTEELLGQNLIVVKVNATSLGSLNSLFVNLRYLREAIPASMAIVIFVNLNLTDTYNFENPTNENVEILSLSPEATSTVLKFRYSDFSVQGSAFWGDLDAQGDFKTPTAEALALDVVPYITDQAHGHPNHAFVAESFDLSSISNLIESVTAKYEEFCVLPA